MTMAASLVLKLSCALLLACIVVFAPQAEAAISCGTVVSKVSPCITYLQGRGAMSPSCCAGVRSLNALASTTPDRKTACGCLKSASNSVPGIKPALSAGLPGKCGVNIPYKISPTTDCSKVR